MQLYYLVKYLLAMMTDRRTGTGQTISSKHILFTKAQSL